MVKKLGEKLISKFWNLIDCKLIKLVIIVIGIYYIPEVKNLIKWNLFEVLLVSIAVVYGLPPVFDYLEEKFNKFKETVYKAFEVFKDIKDIKKLKKDIENLYKEVKDYKDILIKIRSDIEDVEKDLYGFSGKKNSGIGIGINLLKPWATKVANNHFRIPSFFDEQKGIKEKLEDIENRVNELESKKGYY